MGCLAGGVQQEMRLEGQAGMVTRDIVLGASHVCARVLLSLSPSLSLLCDGLGV